MNVRDSSEEIVGREAEMRRLRAAIRKRESMLILGPAGAGKTFLLRNVLVDLDGNLAGHWLYADGAAGLRELLHRLLRQILEAEDPYLLARLAKDGTPRLGFPEWLEAQSSLRLRGLLYHAAEQRRYWIFLDHLPPLTQAVARVVKELVRMRGTPVYLLARGCGPEHIGKVTDLYWMKENRLPLGPLPEPAARRLLEASIERYGLADLDLKGFRQEVLRLSGGLPGAIVKMCALAADPRYWVGPRIKTRLVKIDSLLGSHQQKL